MNVEYIYECKCKRQQQEIMKSGDSGEYTEYE